MTRAAHNRESRRRSLSLWIDRAVAIGAAAYLSFQLWPLALGEGQNDLRAYYFAARTWVMAEPL